MSKWVISVIVGVISDPKVQEFLIQAAKRIVGDAIVEKVLGYLPAMFASMLDTTIKQIPGIENIKDLPQVVDSGREVLNRAIPDFDTGFKPLDDLLDIWRPKG
jgi:hypothetical protein